MKLIIPREIEKQIAEVVYEFSSFKETGVSLFGDRIEGNFKVLGIAGPGPEATHEELHYSGNNDYATMIFEDLKKGNPNLKHIGELHLHPFGMHRLWWRPRDRERGFKRVRRIHRRGDVTSLEDFFLSSLLFKGETRWRKNGSRA